MGVQRCVWSARGGVVGASLTCVSGISPRNESPEGRVPGGAPRVAKHPCPRPKRRVCGSRVSCGGALAVGRGAPV